MADFTTRLADIEVGTNQLLESKGLSVHEFDIADLPELKTATAVNTAFVDGSLQRASHSTYRWDSVFWVTLVIKNVHSEKARRHAIYPLVAGVMQILTNAQVTVTDGQTIRDIDHSPLRPRRITRVLNTQSHLGYRIELGTSFYVEALSEEEATKILTLALDYLLDATGDIVNAQDTLEYEE